MSTNTIIIVTILLIAFGGAFFFLNRGDRFELPKGETLPLVEEEEESSSEDDTVSATGDNLDKTNVTNEDNIVKTDTPPLSQTLSQKSSREIFVTDGVRHSIPLNEILSGGPPKDGIPSIDNPKFVEISDADTYLSDDNPGLGLSYKGETRFYPYSILVWHELVNDTVAGDPLLISYCPLCLTGIIFDRELSGVATEFGVSGRLWRSNLLMYNRAASEDDESLWSQVLGEAVLGGHTGQKLTIIPSDAVLYGDWKRKHPNTKILSKDTGFSRNYERDPYGNYYTNRDVSFGASFNDDRLHPKAFVLGIEINGQFKAYDNEALPVGETKDIFVGEDITIEKSAIGGVRMFIGPDKQPLSYVGAFWFSWLAVHPDTELFN